jgi:S-DNA-T family DNA segregation ATPase FtsK/SpoIIIE
VEIVYSKVDMPTLFKLDSIQAYKEFSFPIGMTWGREITTSLMDIPHFLVAGESGGGKSTFISMMTAVLLATNENLKVIFVDMKGGMQARIFEGVPKVEIASEPSDVATKLGVVLKALDNRMETLRQANARDIDAYNRKTAGQRPQLNRILFIVDEFSELVPKFSSGDRKVLTEINQGILRLARMGRACGIHLVVGIQKPDANNLDPGIKANLPGIICFPVTHFLQSMLILGDGRAADLPSEVKGRAIWKYGIDQIEVQTPYVSENESKSWQNR